VREPPNDESITGRTRLGVTMSLLNGGETSQPFGKGNSECRNLPGSKAGLRIAT
jgi:hypothetical protein